MKMVILISILTLRKLFFKVGYFPFEFKSEGISISVPIYYATGSRLKALFYTLISALSEPFGAVVTYLFLYRFITDGILGLLFSFIAGIMLQISFLELLPASLNYNSKKLTNLFFIIGIIFMLLKFLNF